MTFVYCNQMAYIAGVEHLKHNVMKAQDLRLGNLYMRGNKVEEFTDQVMHEVIYGALQNCEPILLTEEWMERFGFEKWKNEKIWATSGMLIYGSSKDGFLYEKASSRTKLKFVHSLQNLYFAITNKELEICK